MDMLADEFDEGVLDDELSSSKAVTLSYEVGETEVGQRLDKLASARFSEFSRASLQKFIENGELLVNGVAVKPKYAVKMGDVLCLQTVLREHSADLPENIPLEICYEDDDVLVINKPAGMVVHPGAGNATGTLVNALLYHYPAQAHLPRAGLVHRIDKDTTGLLLVAKTAKAQLDLIEQLKEKSVYRHYQCVVAGTLPTLAAHRTIDLPIARHPRERTKMAVRQGGKTAVTHLTNITPLNERYCLLDVALETGRTHQIRVHLSHVGHALVGDRVYGTRQPKAINQAERELLLAFSRQALHAHTLGFRHPVTGKSVEVAAALPEDMRQLVLALSEF